MSKKKVLLVNEAHFLSTGYSVYGKELLSRLNTRYEVAELAAYASPNDRRLQNCPWKVYPNQPEYDNSDYQSSPLNLFGKYIFDNVCLDFKPDYVLDIRDHWMMSYEETSGFRDYYNWIIMPTVDAYPQNVQWMNTYANADAVLTYQDWSGEVLKKQGKGSINYLGSAPPAASETFKPLSKDQCRQRFGIPTNIKIVGTVMRNQRRKLYPELFEAFREYLDKSKKKDVYLYCHTSYPDMGWDLPTLLKEYGLSSNVLFTYKCRPIMDGNGRIINDSCGHIFASTFRDVVTVCPNCGLLRSASTDVQHSVSTEILAEIYNTFDLYVQYANCEGFGMPIVEAAACGIPVCGTDYSAMTDVIRKLDGYPIPPITLYKELETGCNRAIPDKSKFIAYLETFFNQDINSLRRKTRKNYDEHYSSWDKTANMWIKAIESVPLRNRWNNQPRLHNPERPTEQVNKMDNYTYVNWLIVNVLGRPEYLNSYFSARILRDLTNNQRLHTMHGFMQADESHLFSKPRYDPFNREIAYRDMVGLCNYFNECEVKRCNLQ